jgi:branched-chain amino acid:cation transporter, LIVCS family
MKLLTFLILLSAFMKSIQKLDIYATGLAIFAMFFGAGNIIYPLAIGQYALDKTPAAITGLILTAVVMPFLGLFALFLFHGKTQPFFARMGKLPGLLVATLAISLLGPLGSTPRCVSLSYSTFKMSFPELSVIWFSGIACLIIFFFAYQKGRLLSWLGYVLTPGLVILLTLIIFKGLWQSPSANEWTQAKPAAQLFWHGLKEGYNTMDLLAAFFFAPIILTSIRAKQAARGEGQELSMPFILKASIIGALLLSLIYIGFSFLSSYYAAQLEGVPHDQLLATLSVYILGSQAGLFVNLTVALACLTTAIALIAAFSEFFYRDIFDSRIPYTVILTASLLITFFFATLEFSGISQFLAPILQLLYPTLILLTALNICYRLFGFKPIKIPLAFLFTVTCALLYFSNS